MSDPKVDMSLDDIIKLNKKKVKSEPKSAGAKASTSQTPRSPRGRGRGTARGRGRGAAAQGRNTVSTRRGAKYAVPNKLRKFPGAQTNTRVTGARGRAANKRKLIAQGRQQLVSKARQTLRQNLQQKQSSRKQAILNKYRGITTKSKQAAMVTAPSGRRKLVRPGLGVMQADIEASQVRRKQTAVIQHVTAIQQHISEQSTRNRNRRMTNRLQRRNQRAQITSQRTGGAASTATAQPTHTNEPGHIFTVRVKNEASTAQHSRPVVAQARRSQAVANRMLRNTLQQPMRERRQQARRGARQRLGDSAGISGQVRMLTNSIERLQAQVVSLQHRGSSSTQAARRGGREARRGGHGALRGGGRFNNNNQTSTRGRRGRGGPARRGNRQNSTASASHIPTRRVLL